MTSKLYVNSLEPMQGNRINVTGANSILHAPGHVIGIKHCVQSAFFQISSSSTTAVLTDSYTPKVTGSKLYVTGMCPRYQNNSSTGAWHSSAYLYLQQNGSTVAAYEHVGTLNHSGESSTVVPFEYQTTDTVTAGVSVEFTVLHHPTNGGLSTWYFGRSMGGANCYTRMTIMEIAQ